MRWGLWRLCTGEEILLPPPTAPVHAAEDPDAVRSAAKREYKYDIREYKESLRRNDRTIGLIRTYIAEDQLQHLDGKTKAKDVWYTLAEKHKDSISGFTAYYTKIGILEKKYVEDESMHAHLSFLGPEG
jgi:hypothetical protein